MNKIKKWISILCIAVIVLSCNRVFAVAYDYFSISGEEVYSMAYEVVERVNEEREAVGADPLNLDENLLSEAMIRAAELAVDYSHTRPNGEECFSIMLNKGMHYGENIAYGQTTSEDVMNAWMNSQGHRENILRSSFKNIGVGCFIHNGNIYWVQLFNDAIANMSTTKEDVVVTREIETTSSLYDFEFAEPTVSMTVGAKKYMYVFSMNPGASDPGWPIYSEIQPETFVWKSSNESVASVDAYGNVTAIAAGSADITAALPSGRGITAKITVVNLGAVTGIRISPHSRTLNGKGVGFPIGYSVSPSNAINRQIIWTSSDTSVASVSGSGWVTAYGDGTAIIRATTVDGGYTDECEVTVTGAGEAVHVSGLSLDQNIVKLVGEREKVTLKATITPADASNQTILWSSSNTDVATVSAGVVTALSDGETTITATTNDGDFTASCKVTVQIPIYVTGVALDDDSITMNTEGQTHQLRATIQPDNAWNKNVTWKTNNSSVAIVSEDGLVTAIGNGTARITVTTEDRGYTDYCSVKVDIPGVEEIETPKETETESSKETESETSKETEPDIPEKPTPPSVVGNLKAVSAGKNRVKLTWTASSGAEGYLVYAQKDGKYGYVGMTTKGTSYTDTKALDADYNFYWVFPYVKDSTGKMHPGGCTKYVYAKGVCPAVTNLKASSVSGGVKLTWTAAAGAEGYLVYGIENGETYGYVGMTTGTTFTAKKASKTVYNFYWIFPYHKNTDGKMITGGVAPYTYGRAR